MLKAATRMISVRIRNMTLRCTCTQLEEAAIGVLPVGDAQRPLGQRLADGIGGGVRFVGVAQMDLDLADGVGQLEEELRGGERQEDEAAVVFLHADLEDRGDPVGAQPRHGAEDRDAALRRDHGDAVADPDLELPRQAGADDDGVLALEGGQVTRADIAGDDRAGAEILRRDAADQAAGRAAGIGGQQHLPLHHRRGAFHLRQGADAGGGRRRNPSAGPASPRCRDARSARGCRPAIPAGSRPSPISTTISVATPSAMPTSEKPAMTETKRSPLRAQR